MDDLEQEFEEIKALVEARYNPRGNVHNPGKYISGSGLTKNRAEVIARAMIRSRQGKKGNDVPRYFSYLGNTLSGEAFQDIPYQEIKSTYPVGIDDEGDEWVIQGHCDGLIVKNNHVFVLEHKSHMINFHQGKYEVAKRQASLYLAMMHFRVKEAGRSITFPVAEWEPPTQPEFTWLPRYKPGGVIVCVATARPPPTVSHHRLTESDLQDILDFYVGKAQAVLQSVIEENVDAAKLWDTSELGQLELD